VCINGYYGTMASDPIASKRVLVLRMYCGKTIFLATEACCLPRFLSLRVSYGQLGLTYLLSTAYAGMMVFETLYLTQRERDRY
jgi:hypothetical protein